MSAFEERIARPLSVSDRDIDRDVSIHTWKAYEYADPIQCFIMPKTLML